MKRGSDEPGGTSLYAFLKQPSMVDYPGRMAAVFFTTGCNFTCGYCHNPLLMRRRQVGLTWERLEAVCREFTDNWTTAAVITGGEPTHAPDLGEITAFFKKIGWLVKLDTNGSRPDVLGVHLSEVDYVAMDVKAGASRYRELTGFADVERILESIEVLKSGGTDYELRTTLIESFHDDAQLLEMAGMIRGAKRYVLQPFVPKEEMPDEEYRTLPRTSPSRLEEARDLMRDCAEEVLIRGA